MTRRSDESPSSSAMTTSPALRDAWDSYLAALNEMRERTEQAAFFKEKPEHRAKAYHTLMELQAFAYNWAIAPRQFHPRVFRNLHWQSDIYTLGQNAPDTLNMMMFVDGRQTYRLTGHLGAAEMTTLQVYDGIPGMEKNGDVTGKTSGHYDWGNFHTGPTGEFEIILSAEEHPGNWIKLNRDYNYQLLQVRHMVMDWTGDPGELRLKLLSRIPDDYYDAEEFDEAAIARRIRLAEAWVRFITVRWNIGYYDMFRAPAGGRKNVMSQFPGDNATFQMGNKTTAYNVGIFEHADDEALIVEVEKPNGVYWSFQLGDVWGRSLPYANRMGSLNALQAAFDTDDVLRIVICHLDPGVANWLDSARRTEGTLVLRNYKGAAMQAPPTIRRVKFADLENLLPAATKRVTPDERQSIYEQRRLGQLNLLGE